MNRLCYELTKNACGLLGRLYFRLTSVGRKSLPRGGFVIASTHNSHLDPVLVGSMTPPPLHFMARHTLFRPAPWGTFLKMIGAIPLDRQGIGKDCIASLLAKLNAGYPVLVFPEGTRSPDGYLGRLKSGAVRIARSSGVPIVPVVVEGSFRAMGKGKRFPRPTKIRVRFGEPIPVPPDAEDRAVLDQLRDALIALGAIPRGATNPGATPPDSVGASGSSPPTSTAADEAESNHRTASGAVPD